MVCTNVIIVSIWILSYIGKSKGYTTFSMEIVTGTAMFAMLALRNQ